MAIGETTVTVVGNVSSELARRTTSGGDDVLSFWLRSNERRFDKDEGRWCDGRQLSLKVTCWRRMAATVGASLAKGDPVIVTGRLSTNRFEAEGQQRSIPELEATAIGPNLSWCTASVRRFGRKGALPDGAADARAAPVGAGTGPRAPHAVAGFG
ncbi:single-stranded DNA-binding protein [Prauserella marina]|uniref:Single-strand DNA-binding protein n=1 Tax=Prauserella marina TaxID=530584 RepID=A0A222VMR3_9PSEU|nr:single-stranded DNA-binding protein [Prauserella marina]ASR35011.1 single-stranded DNA-binding protein [Prauserella marina]PWV85257.1 single-strand DNA-binding protein [Prauserella marina]SDC01226.1 single-strand DNA-binding protein [Prauserella marina]